MSLPADVRKRLGLAQGGMVYVEETEGGVVLRTVPQIVAQALAKQYADMPGSSVADFLAGRGNESGE
jgi:AbrB family looped-hinge helix DNA binding protein